MAKREIRRIPRWLYAEDVVPLDDWIKLPPEVFRNDTIWPFHLEYLSIAGFPVYTGGTNTGLWWGGIGPKIDVEIGFSGISDINLVSAISSAVCSHTELANIQNQRVTDPVGLTRHLRYPYRLPRDSGFTGHVRYREEFIGLPNIETAQKNPLQVLLHGVDVVTGMPVQFGACVSNETFKLQDEATLESADMYNRGIHDVDIYEVSFVAPASITTGSDERNLKRAGLLYSYLLNPMIGERWMPGSEEIPIAHLAPLTVEGTTDRDLGPQSYFFPEGTYLHRRQQLGLRINNNDDTNNQAFSVALFGYLEVQ